MSEVELQRQHYARTAGHYETIQSDHEAHYFALAVLVGLLDHLEIKTILDVGSGTGKAVRYLKQRRPDLRVIGLEPVKEMRDLAVAEGVSPEDIIEGDATRLPFEAGAFDLVCEFGALHHIRRADLATSEMLRVARRAIFISDANNFGQGSPLARGVKQALDFLKLWKVADFVRTKGKGYMVSEGEGVYYSYSAFNDYASIRAQCQSVHVINLTDAGINPYRTAGIVGLLGIKK